MQTTHYKADENEAFRRAPHSDCTLEAHHDFADDVLGEKKPLQPAARSSQGVMNGIMLYTRGVEWVVFVWFAELLWIMFIIMGNSMEMWGSCPFEMGLTPVCKYCYSGSFITWGSVLVVLWFLNLYLYVLLCSRGFQCRLRTLGFVFRDNEAGGIPTTAIKLFLGLSGALVFWIIAGAFLLFLSNSCQYSSQIYLHHQRSPIMFNTAFATVMGLPFMLFFGRCSDVREIQRAYGDDA